MTTNPSTMHTESSIILEDKTYFYGHVLPKVTLSEQEKATILAEFPVPTLPESEKAVHVQDFNDNEVMNNVVVLISDVEVKTTTNGKPYLDIVFSNNRGSFKGKLWSDETTIGEHVEFFKQHTIISISGTVNEFPKNSGNKSLVLRSFLPYIQPMNPMALLPATDKNMEHLTLELVHTINQLQEPHRTLARTGLKTIWSGFSLAPGAKFHHHAYLGGLLKHTLGLIRLSRFLTEGNGTPSQHMVQLLQVIEREHRIEMSTHLSTESGVKYQKLTWGGSIDHIFELIYQFATLQKTQPLDRDLLISSALFHDFAKYFELSYYGEEATKFSLLFPHAHREEVSQAGGITMDEQGALMGHIPLGILYFQRSVEAANVSMSVEQISQYMHNILSHHGKLEWGTSVTPKTATAVALHFVDYLDSRYENYELSIKK